MRRQTFPIHHFARAVLPEHDPDRTYLMVFHGYFDASGNEAQRSSGPVTVAGYIASEKVWGQFEKGWANVLRRYGVKAFSAAECAAFQKEFHRKNGWDEARRDAFLAELIEEKRKAGLRGFATALRFDDYDSVNLKFQFREQVGGPYAYASGLCISKARKARKIGPHNVDNLLFFFERGDTGQHHLTDLMEREVWEGQLPQFPRKRWVENGKEFFLRPFEAADFYAWEIRRAVRAHDESRPYREIVIDLNKILDLENGWLEPQVMIENAIRSGIPFRDGSQKFSGFRPGERGTTGFGPPRKSGA